MTNEVIIHDYSTQQLTELVFHLIHTQYAYSKHGDKHDAERSRVMQMGEILGWPYTRNEQGHYTWHIAEDSKLWLSHLAANKLGLRLQLVMTVTDIAKKWQHLRKNEYVSYSSFWVNSILKKHNIPTHKGTAKNAKLYIYLCDLHILIANPPQKDIEEAK